MYTFCATNVKFSQNFDEILTKVSPESFDKKIQTFLPKFSGNFLAEILTKVSLPQH